MSSPLKQQIDQGLNTASMMAMAIPEVGAIAGGLIMGGQFIFDQIISFPKNTDPLDRFPTEHDIIQAIADIQSAIKQSLDQQEMQDVQSHLVEKVNTLRGSWDDVGTAHGLTFVGKFKDSQTEATWIHDKSDAMEGPLRPGVNGETPLMLHYVHKIQELGNKPRLVQVTGSGVKHPEGLVKVEIVGLYIWAVNIFLMYCKIAMLWQYVKALRAHNIADFKTEAERKKIGGELVSWQFGDKKTPKPVVPPKLAAMVDMATFDASSAYIDQMRLQLGGPPEWRNAAIAGKSKPAPDKAGNMPDTKGSYLMLQYLMEIHEEATAAREKVKTELARHKKATSIKKRTKTIRGSIGQDFSTDYYSFHDTISTYTSHEVDTAAQAQSAMQYYFGQIEIELIDKFATPKGYGAYTPEIIKGLKDVIDAWTKGLSNAQDFLEKYKDVKVPPIFGS